MSERLLLIDTIQHQGREGCAHRTDHQSPLDDTNIVYASISPTKARTKTIPLTHTITPLFRLGPAAWGGRGEGGD